MRIIRLLGYWPPLASLAFGGFIGLLLPKAAYAQTRTFDPLKKEVTEAGPQGVATIKGLEAIFFNVVVVILSLAGIVLFIMLIIGGFKYLTAGSSQEQTQSARQTLTYAFIGFIVIVAAFLILRLIGEFTGVQSILQFQVTQP